MYREAQEQARAAEEGRRKNLELFQAMFLSLGADCIKLDGTRHDAELMEAKALAAHRWSRLRDLEGQVQREEQTLAARPRKRPQAPGDDLIATEVIGRMETAFAAETDGMRAGLEQLREQAQRERKELESFKR